MASATWKKRHCCCFESTFNSSGDGMAGLAHVPLFCHGGVAGRVGLDCMRGACGADTPTPAKSNHEARILKRQPRHGYGVAPCVRSQTCYAASLVGASVVVLR